MTGGLYSNKTQRTRTWLWPDRVVGKRESRQLRDEHNALVNSHDDLRLALAALHGEVVALVEAIEEVSSSVATDDTRDLLERAYEAIRRAEGGAA